MGDWGVCGVASDEGVHAGVWNSIDRIGDGDLDSRTQTYYSNAHGFYFGSVGGGGTSDD